MIPRCSDISYDDKAQYANEAGRMEDSNELLVEHDEEVADFIKSMYHTFFS